MRKFILTFVLGTLCLGAFSQEAFYIYRNDGDFNGFFYDEVLEIRQSKIGVDSVVYDKWVTQEVVLKDTIYRIPLAAIDSIGFQQPEIIINSEVRHMDLLGMTPYVTSRVGQTLTFSTDLPANLMPQVGNVLYGMEGIFEEENFGGRVTSVRNESSGIIVETNQLTKMSDIFVQFIGMEEVGYMEDNPDQLSYRAAGMNKIKQDGGSFSAYLFNINTALHLPILPDRPVNGSIDANIGFKCKMAMLYQITDDVYFIKYAVRTDIDLQAGVTINASVDTAYSVPLIPEPFGTIKWPVYPPFSLIEIKPVPRLGYRWGGSLTAQMKLPAVKGYICHSIIIDSDLPYGMTYTEHKDLIAPDLKGLFDTFLKSDAEIRLDGYYQFGLREEVAVETDPVFGAIIHAKTGIDCWLGPKFEGSFNVNMTSFLTSDDGPYIFKDSHIGVSPISLDMEAFGLYSYYGLDKPVKHKWAEGSWDLFPKVDFYAFPEFAEFGALYNDTTYKFLSWWKASPRIFIWPCKAGIAMYKNFRGEPKIFASQYCSEETLNILPNSFSMEIDAKKFKVGKYKMVPTLNVSGTEYLIRSWTKEVDIPLITDIPSKTLHFNANGDEAMIQFTTNCPQDGITFEKSHYTSSRMDTIDPENGVYELYCTLTPNRSLFMAPSVLNVWDYSAFYSNVEYSSPKLSLLAANSEYECQEDYFIGFVQNQSSLSNVSVDISGDADFTRGNWTSRKYAGYHGPVTCTRQGDNIILITGTNTEINEYDANDKTICTINMTLTRDEKFGGFTLSGSMTKKVLYGNTQSTSCTFNFASELGYTFSDAYDGNITFNNAGSITIHSSSYVEGGETWNQSSEGGVRGSITVKAPGEE